MSAVVIMAGGRGLRLHPLTARTPQPLLRVGSKPLLETIIVRFAEQGFRKFYLAVHYHADLIERYFGNGRRWEIVIEYLREPEPLGTAGAIHLLPPMAGPFIVSNADILADIDYRDLLGRHRENQSVGQRDATVCVALYQHQVPFGVVGTDADGRVIVREKPIENFQVVAGVYVLPPKAVWMSGPGKCDMPELLDRLRVGTYEILGPWYDVGRFEDLTRAHVDWRINNETAVA